MAVWSLGSARDVTRGGEGERGETLRCREVEFHLVPCGRDGCAHPKLIFAECSSRRQKKKIACAYGGGIVSGVVVVHSAPTAGRQSGENLREGTLLGVYVDK